MNQFLRDEGIFRPKKRKKIRDMMRNREVILEQNREANKENVSNSIQEKGTARMED